MASRRRLPEVDQGGSGERPRIGASYTLKSRNRKLSPVLEVEVPGAERPTFLAEGPFIDTTNVSIEVTCSSACLFKGNGCHAQSGFTKFQATKRDVQALGHTAEEVIAEECRLIDESHGGGPVPEDGARGGRDLRLHDSGDVGSEAGARILAGAAERYRARGGGSVFTYTHWWREIPREACGSALSVLASVEKSEDIELARERGYAAAIVVDEFRNGKKSFPLPGTTAKIVPCPHETGAGAKKDRNGEDRPITCVECRLCFDADRLFRLNIAVGFEAHGPGAALVRLRLGREHGDVGFGEDTGAAHGIRTSESPIAMGAALTTESS